MDHAVADRVARVRAFNRFYTGVIGIMNDHSLQTRWNVSEARVIFELATRGGADTASLRRDLGLDSGYLSRMLSKALGAVATFSVATRGRGTRTKGYRLTVSGPGEPHPGPVVVWGFGGPHRAAASLAAANRDS